MEKEFLGNDRSKKAAFEMNMEWWTQLYAFFPLSRNN